MVKLAVCKPTACPCGAVEHHAILQQLCTSTDARLSTCKDGLVSAFDAEAITEFCKDQVSDLRRLRAEAPTCPFKCEAVEVMLQDMLVAAPLIADLLMPAVKLRHWEQVFANVGTAFVSQNFGGMKLHSLLEMQLPSFADAISDIVDAAHEEARIEQKLAEVRDQSMFTFPLGSHEGEGLFAFTPDCFEEALSAAEEMLVVLSAIRSSRFHSPFGEELAKLQHIITLSSDTAQTLQACQKMWIELNKYFQYCMQSCPAAAEAEQIFRNEVPKWENVLFRLGKYPTLQEFCTSSLADHGEHLRNIKHGMRQSEIVLLRHELSQNFSAGPAFSDAEIDLLLDVKDQVHSEVPVLTPSRVTLQLFAVKLKTFVRLQFVGKVVRDRWDVVLQLCSKIEHLEHLILRMPTSVGFLFGADHVQLKQVKTLRLQFGQSTDGGFAAALLTLFPRLADLDISGSPGLFSDEGCIALCESISTAQFQSVKHLDVSDTLGSPEAGEFLGKFLRKFTGLETISMTENYALFSSEDGNWSPSTEGLKALQRGLGSVYFPALSEVRLPTLFGLTVLFLSLQQCTELGRMLGAISSTLPTVDANFEPGARDELVLAFDLAFEQRPAKLVTVSCSISSISIIGVRQVALKCIGMDGQELGELPPSFSPEVQLAEVQALLAQQLTAPKLRLISEMGEILNLGSRLDDLTAVARAQDAEEVLKTQTVELSLGQTQENFVMSLRAL